MYRIDAYHRPTSVAEAVDLLAAPTRSALAGGTAIRHDGGATPTEVVDLQALGLDEIEAERDIVRIGAMARLSAVAEHEAVPDLVRRAARGEMPSTLRTLATVGGTIGTAASDSVFLAALLVHDASVHFADGGSIALSSVLHDGLAAGELIVAVEVQPSGPTALAATGRTPADDPIVAAVARSADDGIRLALCGVGPTPELVDVGDLDRLEPPADFRGSTAYRRHLARVLSARVLEELS
ncbi:FAD binding domain-containing protein [Ilumatobacter sp.]|uniref:FAD binding domain-containing protein n=1 Tax=Ilumatobacter sp. TaxID=1967498 RepID=UPI003AF81481